MQNNLYFLPSIDASDQKKTFFFFEWAHTMLSCVGVCGTGWVITYCFRCGQHFNSFGRFVTCPYCGWSFEMQYRAPVSTPIPQMPTPSFLHNNERLTWLEEQMAKLERERVRITTSDNKDYQAILDEAKNLARLIDEFADKATKIIVGMKNTDDDKPHVCRIQLAACEAYQAVIDSLSRKERTS